jgi:hypothetical protein
MTRVASATRRLLGARANTCCSKSRLAVQTRMASAWGAVSAAFLNVTNTPLLDANFTKPTAPDSRLTRVSSPDLDTT